MGVGLRTFIWAVAVGFVCVLTANAQQENAPSIALPRCAPLPRPTQMHACVAIGQRVYVIGGDAAPQGWSNKVYSAEVNDAGCLGTWRAERDLPDYRSYIGTSTEVVNNRIYIISGESAKSATTPESDTVRTRDVLWSSVQADGSLGEWKRTTPFQQEAVSCAATCTTERFLYLVGGQTLNKPTNAIMVAEFSPEGEPKNWRDAGKLPTPLWFQGAAILEERMYVWGGLITSDGATVNGRVYSAPIETDGKVGAWRNETPMPHPVYIAGFCGFNDYLVAVAGQYSGGYPTNTIWYSRLDQGKVGEWKMVKTDLDASLYHAMGLDRTRGTVFITGGQKKSTPGRPTNPQLLNVVQAFRLPQPQATRLDLAGAAPASGQVKTTLDAALLESKATGKNVLAFFYSPEVPACRRFYDNVIMKPGFAETLGQRVLALVDTSNAEQANWCYKYSVFKVPAFVEILPSGQAKASMIRVAKLADVKAFLGTP